MKSATANPFGDTINLSEMETGADKQIIVCGATGIPVYKDMTGDITISNLGATTLKNTGPGVQSTTVTSMTIDAQGRVTAASSGTVPKLVDQLTKGSGADGAYNPGASGALTSGCKNYTSINIGGAYTITTSTDGSCATYIKCSGNAVIAGTLSDARQSAVVGDGGTAGGTGGAGLVVNPLTYTNAAGTLTVATLAPAGGAGHATNGGGGGASYGAGGNAGGGTAGATNVIRQGASSLWIAAAAGKELCMWLQKMTAWVGSGGGGGGNDNSSKQAGGILFLDVYGNLTLSGTISMNGETGASGTNAGSGGCGGGCIIIRCYGNFDGTGGTITAAGGTGGAGSAADGDGGGGGGGGFVLILVGGTSYTAPTISVSGGAGGAKGGGAGNAGSAGSAGLSVVLYG